MMRSLHISSVLVLLLAVLLGSAFGELHLDFFPSGQPTVDSQGFTHHSVSVKHKDRVHSLNYSVKPAEDALIRMDKYASGLTVHSCSKTMVMIKPHSHGMASRFLSKINPGYSILVGNYSAGCITASGKAAPLMKRVVSFSTNHQMNGMIRLHVEDAMFADVFQHANISYSEYATNVNQSTPDVKIPVVLELSREQMMTPATPVDQSSGGGNKRRSFGSLSTPTGTVQAMEPWTGTSVNSTEQLTISWESTGVPAGEVITLSVYDSDSGSSKLISQYTIASTGDGAQATYITIGDISTWAPGQYYYVSYSCASSCSTVQGNYFTVNYWPQAGIVSPTSQSSFIVGVDGAIQVNWVVDPSHLKYSCTLYLYISVPGASDPKLTSQSCQMSDLSASISLPSSFSGSWYESSYYYAKIEYDCLIFSLWCKNIQSQYFSVVSTAVDVSVGISTPSEGDLYFSGQTMTVTWSNNEIAQNVGDIPIVITLRQDGWTTSTVRATFDKYLNDGSLSFTVPSGLSESTNYFIEIDWDCNGYHQACKNTQSRRFSINHNPVLTFSAPSFQQVFAPSSTVSSSWTWTGNAIQSVLVQVEQDPSFSTALFPVYKQSFSNGPTSASTSFSSGYILPLVWKVYYDCKIADWFCNVESSPQFYVSDTIQESKAGEVVLFNNETKIDLCEGCGEVDITTTLTGTYNVSTTAMISMFEIYIADFSLVAFRFNISGEVDATLDLILKLHLAYESEIPDIPLFALAYEPSFSIAGISVQVGANLGLFLRTSIAIDATGTLSAGMDGAWEYYIIHQYGPIYASQNSSSSLVRKSFNMHPLSITLDAESTFNFGPVLEASAALTLWDLGASVEADVYLYSQLGAEFSYPALDALDSTELPSTVFSALGNCSVNHYIEFHWSIISQAEFKATLLTKAFGPYDLDILNEPLLFGCFIPQKQVASSSSFSMTIANVAQSTVKTLISMLQEEFADYLVTDPTNVQIQQSSSNSANFQVTVLSGDALSLCNALASTSSALFSSNHPTVTSIQGQVTVDCSGTN
jgi:hypothetical protein